MLSHWAEKKGVGTCLAHPASGPPERAGGPGGVAVGGKRGGARWGGKSWICPCSLLEILSFLYGVSVTAEIKIWNNTCTLKPFIRRTFQHLSI